MAQMFRIVSETTPEETFFDRQERITWWDQKVLSEAKVLVAGAGALGNETIKNLALLGVRKFLICDFDEISTSNLSRTVLFNASDIGRRKALVAAERCRDLILDDRPDVEFLDGDLSWELGLGRVAECSIVLSCLDNIEARKSLAWAARKTSIPFIDAGIAELSGQVGVYPDGARACYSCNLSTAQHQAARKRYSCDDVKRKSIAEEKVPTVQITSAIISAIQCQEAVKILMKQTKGEAFRLTYDGLNRALSNFELMPDPRCAEYFHDPIRYDGTAIHTGMTLEAALCILRKEWSMDVVIDLTGERSFTRSIDCRSCGRENVVNKPSFLLTEDDLICSSNMPCVHNLALNGEIPTNKNQISRFGLDNIGLLPKTLSELGIPDRHIVTVDIEGTFHSLRLSKQS